MSRQEPPTSSGRGEERSAFAVRRPVIERGARREEHLSRRAAALAMGGAAKLRARRDQGVLNARERIDLLIDPDSFAELGLFATSQREVMRDRTPADGKITGTGRIDGRPVAVAANDFTVLGASSSPVNSKKLRHLKSTAARRGMPVVYLGESSGGRIPDSMGAVGVAGGDDPTQYRRLRESPWVSAVLGPCYGSSSWYASMSDFVVMRKGASLGVASPRLAAMAIGEDVDAEELGGWRVHTRSSGLVDEAVDTDEEAIELIRRFLGYLPSHRGERPPVAAVPAGSDDPVRGEELAALVPADLARTYDMAKVVDAFVDLGSRFELKRAFGRSLLTCLARIDGRPVGIIANNPNHKGGAIDPDACVKATSFLVLCDSFNIPVVLIADQPGFLIGRDGEPRGATGRVMNWMQALSLCTVPKIAMVARKSYGQGVVNMGLGGNADESCAWTTAEISFMNPAFGAGVVLGDRARDGELLAATAAEFAAGTSPYDAASAYLIHEVIDPSGTREYLKQALERQSPRSDAMLGEHLMRAWPTSF